MARDDVYFVFKNIIGNPKIPQFYCSSNVSWKLAYAIDWLRGAIVEALTRPDVRVFYMLQVYHTLLSILSFCHGDLADTVKGKTPYQLLHDHKTLSILEKILKR